MKFAIPIICLLMTIFFDSGESHKTTRISVERGLEILEPYLNAEELRKEDVPPIVASCFAKFLTKMLTSDSAIDFVVGTIYDYKKARKMILEDVKNNEIFFDLLDFITSLDPVEQPKTDAAMNNVIDALMEHFPKPIKLKYLDARDMVKYFLFVDTHPEVMTAIDTFLIESYNSNWKTIIDAKETIMLDNILRQNGLVRSDLGPELLNWFKGFTSRMVAIQLNEDESFVAIDFFQRYYNIMNSIVNRIFNYFKRPDYVTETNKLISNVLIVAEPFLSIISLEDLDKFWEIIFSNHYDLDAVYLLSKEIKLQSINESLNGDSLEFIRTSIPFKSLEEVFNVLHREFIGIFSTPYAQTMNITETNEQIFAYKDVAAMNEEQFLEMIDSCLKKSGYRVKKLSAPLRRFISKIFKRIEQPNYKPNMTRLTKDMKLIRVTFIKLRNKLRDAVTYLEDKMDDPRWIAWGATYKSFVAPVIRAVPHEEYLKLVEIAKRDPKLILTIVAKLRLNRELLMRSLELFSGSRSLFPFWLTNLPEIWNTLNFNINAETFRIFKWMPGFL